MSDKKESLIGGVVVKTLTYKEQAYELIKDAVLFNRFRVGAIYSQDEICEELGISRTPVREALLELQKEGYVAFARGRGVKVVPVTDEIAKDILEIRLLTEQNSAYLAAARANDQSVKDIFNCLQNLEDQLETRDGIKPRRTRRGTVLNVSHCMFYKVVAVGFNTLCYDASVGVLNPPHE
ncbi:GntR family transcriptional regulator [Treponema medium]|uniref:GntR family transcriptional regulator n=1 Tax=Treponema medium TaxID=58231 RepID=UPI00197FBC2A|nr:GntR family transcriptional regulator [Treponema medium]QSH92932.1 GntR family transcriptional regulator [Treponema medium]